MAALALAGVDPAKCLALSQLQCVFLIALGRTGSSHVLRLLNGIEGYRLSGETDNAWIYMGRYARARLSSRSHLVAARRATHDDASWVSEDVSTIANRSDVLCQARQMMLVLHNPIPRARCDLIVVSLSLRSFYEQHRSLPTAMYCSIHSLPFALDIGCLASRRSILPW